MFASFCLRRLEVVPPHRDTTRLRSAKVPIPAEPWSSEATQPLGRKCVALLQNRMASMTGMLHVGIQEPDALNIFLLGTIWHSG